MENALKRERDDHLRFAILHGMTKCGGKDGESPCSSLEQCKRCTLAEKTRTLVRFCTLNLKNSFKRKLLFYFL